MDKLMATINKFRDERNWRQFHNEKDLAISISIEASELLEIFQWKSSEEAIKDKLPAIKEELADILIYSLMFADNLCLDVNKIIEEKLAVNSQKYPISKSHSSNKKYTEFDKDKN